MKTYFEMTLPEMLAKEHKYIGFIRQGKIFELSNM
jgi:hypothetical protein